MTAALMRADLVIGDGQKAPLWRRLPHSLARYDSVRRIIMRLCQKLVATRPRNSSDAAGALGIFHRSQSTKAACRPRCPPNLSDLHIFSRD